MNELNIYVYFRSKELVVLLGNSRRLHYQLGKYWDIPVSTDCGTNYVTASANALTILVDLDVLELVNPRM